MSDVEKQETQATEVPEVTENTQVETVETAQESTPEVAPEIEPASEKNEEAPKAEESATEVKISDASSETPEVSEKPQVVPEEPETEAPLVTEVSAPEAPATTENPEATPVEAPAAPEEEKVNDDLILTESGLYRTKPLRNPTYKDFVTELFPGCETVDASFRARVKESPNERCMGYRDLIAMHKEDREISGIRKVWDIPEFGPMKWFSFSEIDKTMTDICSGLIHFTGCNKGDVAGIFLDTCGQWIQYAHGCWRAGLTIATCYANLGVESLEYAINQCGIRCMLINGSTIDTFISLKEKIPTLEYLVYIGDLKTTTDLFKVVSLEDIEKLGAENPQEPREHSGDDLCTIMYTSGSTGLPKGVEVPHRSLNAAASAISLCIDIDCRDTYLGFLPLAHILELTAEHAMYFRGASIGYGSPQTLVDDKAKPMGDLRAVNPTLMAGVPRVFDTIKKGVLYKVDMKGGLAKFLFTRALRAKMSAYDKGKKANFWDKLVFKKLRGRLGLERIRAVLSGGAPMNAETQKFIHVLLNTHVLQGYGLTETCGGGTVQFPGKCVTGEIGPPIASAEICLEDVPDMGYFVKDGYGQVLIRGANVNRGYYKQPELTKEVFLPDGWFRTGDIGSFTDHGTVRITDRIKNLVKLSHGEYVALEPLESLYGSNSSFVSPNGICVYGNSETRHIVATMYPNPPVIVEWAKKNGVDHTDFSALTKNESLRAAVLEDFNVIAKRFNRASFEHIKDVHISDVEWTPENGMLTSAMKLQRATIYKFYKEQLDAMYAKIED